MTEEENLKIKFLDLEKRFVELEMSVSKLKDQLKGLEGIKMDELLERVEELEDLILVESAAANELRNLIESNDTTEIKGEVENLRKTLEEKVGNLEKSFSEISEKLVKFNEEISKLKEEIQTKEETKELESFKMEIDEKISNLENSFSEISNEVKKKLEELENLKTKIEDEINKRLPESFLTDFVKLENEVGLLKVNFSSLSKEVERIFSDVQLLKPDVIKEVLSKVVEIRGEMENKYQEIISFSSSLAGSKEKIKEIPVIQSKIDELVNQISQLKASLELINTQLSLFSSKKELEDLKSMVNSLEKELSEFKNTAPQKNDVDKISNIVTELEKRIEDINLSLSKNISETKMLAQAVTSLSSSLAEIKNKEQTISNYVRIEDFSNLVIDFKRISQELEKIKKDELTFLTKDEMKGMKEEIENLKKSIEELKSIAAPKNVIQSMANKIEFLEARLKELENLSKEKIKPIILE